MADFGDNTGEAMFRVFPVVIAIIQIKNGTTQAAFGGLCQGQSSAYLRPGFYPAFSAAESLISTYSCLQLAAVLFKPGASPTEIGQAKNDGAQEKTDGQQI